MRDDAAIKELTFDFERTPPVESIQIYSAIAVPFWSRDMYFSNCVPIVSVCSSWSLSMREAVVEAMV